MYVPDGPLSAADIDHFLEYGFVIIENAFDAGPGSLPAKWIERSWERVGYDPNDPATWELSRVIFTRENTVSVNEFSPVTTAAMAQLLGGADRMRGGGEVTWADSFIANYHLGADEPWKPAGPDVDGWHKDGDFFRHFLDSPEQALLTIVLWDDVVHQGGPTYLAPDSIKPVAEMLVQHPEGVAPSKGPEVYDMPEGTFGPDYEGIVKQCSDFREMTGRGGTVVLMHPYMLHASSQNVIRRPRFITNPPIAFAEPMCFDRPDGAYSAVEQCILNALGVERLDWQITHERERLVPPRVRNQRNKAFY